MKCCSTHRCKSANALSYRRWERTGDGKIVGVILNDKGKIAGSFKNQLNVTPISGLSDTAGVIYNEHTPLAPGIYQVRTAARDEKSGRLGSANQWIVIPDLTKRQLTSSSILLGGTVVENKSTSIAGAIVCRPPLVRQRDWVTGYLSTVPPKPRGTSRLSNQKCCAMGRWY
jgi:hypothetical protein